MYSTLLRYLAVAFTDATSVAPTTNDITELMRAFDFVQLIPSAIQEQHETGMTPRIGFTSIDGSWRFLLLSDQFQVARAANTPFGGELGDFNEFCRNSSTMLIRALDHFQRRPHRLAAVREGYLREMNEERMNEIAHCLMNLPESFINPFEWDWRAASQRDREFGGLRELTYNIATVKRIGAQVRRIGPATPFAPEEPFSRIRVDIDINTAATNTAARFGPEHVNAFFSETAEWQRGLTQEVAHLIGEGEE